MLPLAVPAEAQQRDCHCWGLGRVRDGQTTTYGGTDGQRMLRSKRDNSKRSGGVTSESSHSWTKRLDNTTGIQQCLPVSLQCHAKMASRALCQWVQCVFSSCWSWQEQPCQQAPRELRAW